MLGKSILRRQLDQSPLKGQSSLKPNGFKGKKALMFTLTLTSLIDAFSILVIYLLVNFSSPTASLHVSSDLEIPSAGQSQTLPTGSVVSISRGHYFIDDKEIGADQLPSKLLDLHTKLQKDPSQKDDLVIQADRRIDYAFLSPV